MLSLDGLGLRLREERERLGYNQADFAALAGASRRTQAAYEAGEGSPNVAYLSAISDAGADVIYVLTGRAEARNSDESELVRLYRAAPDAVRQAAIRMFGGTPVGTREIAAPVVQGDVGQVVQGDARAKRMTIKVGGGRRKGGRVK